MTHVHSARADTAGPETAFRTGDLTYDRAAQLALAGGLVAAITHDLRQPLTALEMNIAAALHMLRQPALRIEAVLEALHDALEQHGRMREALEVLEGLSVHREPLCQTTDLLSMVREVVQLVGSDVSARHVSIELTVVAPVPSVYGDRTLMRQAFLNILLDALEATSLSVHPHSPITLAIRQAADTVEVAVTHVGMRAEVAGKDDAWGLALARSVVLAHHGTISMEGDAEAGVRLITRWPISPHDTVQEDHHAQ